LRLKHVNVKDHKRREREGFAKFAEKNALPVGSTLNPQSKFLFQKRALQQRPSVPPRTEGLDAEPNRV
jgi:hypothetical protein